MLDIIWNTKLKKFCNVNKSDKIFYKMKIVVKTKFAHITLEFSWKITKIKILIWNVVPHELSFSVTDLFHQAKKNETNIKINYNLILRKC